MTHHTSCKKLQVLVRSAEVGSVARLGEVDDSAQMHCCKRVNHVGRPNLAAITAAPRHASRTESFIILSHDVAQFQCEICAKALRIFGLVPDLWLSKVLLAAAWPRIACDRCGVRNQRTMP